MNSHLLSLLISPQSLIGFTQVEIKSSILSSRLIGVDSFLQKHNGILIVLIEIFQHETVVDQSEAVITKTQEDFVQNTLGRWKTLDFQYKTSHANRKNLSKLTDFPADMSQRVDSENSLRRETSQLISYESQLQLSVSQGISIFRCIEHQFL